MEIWKDINGWVGYYQVNSNGTVRSLDRNTKSRPVKGQIMKPQLINSGYYSVCLNNGKRQKRYLVHRLVATLFIPTIEGKKYVNHKNGNKIDNRVENLEWVTFSENILHSYKIGTHLITEKHLTRLRKFNTETKSIKIGQYSKSDELIATFNSGSIASKTTGLNYSCIMACVSGKYKNHNTCGGFIWKRIY